MVDHPFRILFPGAAGFHLGPGQADHADPVLLVEPDAADGQSKQPQLAKGGVPVDAQVQVIAVRPGVQQGPGNAQGIPGGIGIGKISCIRHQGGIQAGGQLRRDGQAQAQGQPVDQFPGGGGGGVHRVGGGIGVVGGVMVDVIGGSRPGKQGLGLSQPAQVRAVHADHMGIAHSLFRRAQLVRQGQKPIQGGDPVGTDRFRPLPQLPEQAQKGQGGAQGIPIRGNMGDDGETVPAGDIVP